jgi:hypothetical protein
LFDGCSLFEGSETEVDVAFFFVSYILIAGIMLLNVVRRACLCTHDVAESRSRTTSRSA